MGCLFVLLVAFFACVIFSAIRIGFASLFTHWLVDIGVFVFVIEAVRLVVHYLYRKIDQETAPSGSPPKS